MKQDLKDFVTFVKSFAHSQGHLLQTGATRRGRRERHFCTLSLFRFEELERNPNRSVTSLEGFAVVPKRISNHVPNVNRDKLQLDLAPLLNNRGSINLGPSLNRMLHSLVARSRWHM